MASFDPFLDDPAFTPHVAHWTATCRAADGDFVLRHPWLSLPAFPDGTQDVVVDLSASTSGMVQERTGGDGLGVAAVVLSALSLVLSRHARAEHVIIDTPTLAGDRDGVTDATLPTFIGVDAQGTLGAHLTTVAAQLSATYTHQDFPVAAFAEARLGRGRPASNVLLTVAGVHDTVDASRYDLHVAVHALDALTISVTGRAPSCPPQFVAMIAAHLGQVLAAHRELGQMVAAVDIATADERVRLNREIQVEDTTVPPPGTIPSLFSACAARHPNVEAIRLGDQAYTYAEVDARANRLAHGLITMYGIQPGDAVGVAVSRSPLTIIAMLAVLKTGAIYVPLDPEYPEERLLFMTQDAGIKALLMQSEHIEQLMSLYEIPMFAIDLQLDTLDPVEGPPALVLSPDAPAYIIYTSGSTGQPKAVVLAHGGFVNMIAYHTEALGVGAGDRLLQFYQLSFDSSLFECFMALLTGATLLLVDHATIGDPVAMSTYIAKHGATMLTMPPVYLSTLAVDQLATVSRIISAGDVCRVQDALVFAQRCAYYNSYGPTETTVCTTLYRVDPVGAYGSRIPIGKPIGRTTVLLLDDQLQPVAEGVPGELCVAGISLAIGYLHHEVLTAAQFPTYAGVPGNRIYRTGDMAVRRPDGLLELLGRRDNQVKIRGYRIELGEIEAVLLQADGVREVAVLAQDDATGRRLIAYATGTADEGQLRDAVARRLPEFMVPSAFYLLDEMPTTANGKIDRKALPSLVVADTGSASRDAAETPDQEQLMALWVEVLGRPVGIRDNFFAMGGDSILVIQLVSRARALGLRLTPTQVFEHPTIEELATIAVRTAGSVDEAGPAEGDAPLGPMQQWFLSQQTDAPQHFNQTALFEVSTGLAPNALRAAVGIVGGHHDALRLAFTRTASGWQSAYAPVNRLPIVVVVDLTAVAPTARLDAIRRDGEARQRTFALDASPLFQVIAYTTGTDSTAWVLLIAHHLVIDGVSWRILLDDLQRAYVAAAAGRSLDLPPRTTSYRSWIARLEEESAMFLDELPFWQQHALGSMSLPMDLVPIEAPRMDSSASVHTMLSSDVTEVLLRTAPRTLGVEVQDILLTALVRSTSTWTGRATLPITLESHGRPDLFDDVDTTRLVGWCTSQFPLRLTVDAAASGIDAIKSIKEQVRSVPHLGVGFGVLSYLADAEIGAGLRACPSPPVLFNYLGQVSSLGTADASWMPVLDGVPGDVSPTQVRSHLLEVNAMVAEGALSVTWSYSTKEFLPTTIERLAAAFITELHELVSAMASASGPQFTPSDFPAARIDQDALAVLLGQLGA